MFEGKDELLVVTHNSDFHADDVFAMATVYLAFPHKKIRLIRTRDTNIIETADIVFDVGMKYDPATNRFDHHQTEGAGIRANGVPYAAFGLIWKQFGSLACNNNEEVRDRVDSIFTQIVDATDNGMDVYDQKIFGTLRLMTIDSMIKLFEPTIGESPEIIDQRFGEVVAWIKILLARLILVTRNRVTAEKAMIQSYHAAEDKRVVLLSEESQGASVSTLCQFEEPLYIIRQRPIDRAWSVRCVPKTAGSLDNRKSLPEEWRGKRETELQGISGVPNALFCHKTGFMAVATTKEGAIKMVELALNS